MLKEKFTLASTTEHLNAEMLFESKLFHMVDFFSRYTSSNKKTIATILKNKNPNTF